jgi:hypothetical protein
MNLNRFHHFSAKLYLRDFRDFDDDDNSDTKIFNGSLSWEGMKGQFLITAGRMPLYDELGSHIVDGLHLRMNNLYAPAGLSVSAFAGMPAPQDLSAEMRSFDDGFTAGGSIWIHPAEDIRCRVRSAIVANSEYTDEESSEFKHNEVGILLDWNTPLGVLFETGFEYDFVPSRLSRAFVRADYESPAYLAYYEFLYKEPRIDKYSFFHMFKDIAFYSQVRTGVDVAFGRTYRSGVDGIITLFDGASDYSLDLYVSAWNAATLGYRVVGGDDGEENGIFGSLSYYLTRSLELRAGLDLYRYTLADAPQELENENSYSTFASITFDPRKAFYCGAEVQYLEDRTLKNNVRGLLNCGYRFHFGL